MRLLSDRSGFRDAGHSMDGSTSCMEANPIDARTEDASIQLAAPSAGLSVAVMVRTRVRAMERRRTIRLLSDKGLVSIGRKSKDLPGAGWPLRDISEGGLCFAIPEDMPGLPGQGENVVVTVEFGSAIKGIGKGGNQLSATVRRVKKAGRGEREVSLEFTGLSPADRERIRGTVLDLAMDKVQKGSSVLARPPRASDGKGEPRLGDILVAQSTVSRDDMERFVRENLDETGPLGRQLVAKGLVDETEVAKALAEQSGLRYADLTAEGIDLLKVRRFGSDYLTRHLFVPVSMDAERVTLAAAAPLAKGVVESIAKLCNRRATVAIASERQIVSVIQKAFHIARNRRRSVRFPTGLSVRFKFYDKDWGRLHAEVLVGLTKDVSEGGLLFVGPSPKGVSLKQESLHIGVHLFLPNQDEPVRAPCELIRTTPVRSDDGDGSLVLYGVKVLGISEADRKRLNLYRLGEYVRRTAVGGRAPLQVV